MVLALWKQRSRLVSRPRDSDAGTAVSAVLLYRMITFWAPTVPGYWAFTKLTKDGLL